MGCEGLEKVGHGILSGQLESTAPFDEFIYGRVASGVNGAANQIFGRVKVIRFTYLYSSVEGHD